MENKKLQHHVTWALSTFCPRVASEKQLLKDIQEIVWQAIELEGFLRKEVDEETEYQVTILREFETLKNTINHGHKD